MTVAGSAQWWNRATARQQKLCEPKPPTSTPARVIALRHQPMNRTAAPRGARTGTRSRRAGSAPAARARTAGRPGRGYRRARLRTRQSPGRFPAPVARRGSDVPPAAGYPAGGRPAAASAGALLEGLQARVACLRGRLQRGLASQGGIRLRSDSGKVGHLGEEDHIPELGLLQAVPARGGAAQDGGDASHASSAPALPCLRRRGVRRCATAAEIAVPLLDCRRRLTASAIQLFEAPRGVTAAASRRGARRGAHEGPRGGGNPPGSPAAKPAITPLRPENSGYPDEPKRASAASPSGIAPATSRAQPVPERRRRHHGAHGSKGQRSVPAASEARSCDPRCPD